MATDACLIDDLCKIARRALEPFTLDEPYALVDFPNHANVGDSAIWAGEMAYFRRHAPRPPDQVWKRSLHSGGVSATSPARWRANRRAFRRA